MCVAVMKIGSDGGAEKSLGRRRKKKRVTEERVCLWRCVAVMKISREGGAENSLARRRRKHFTEERVSLWRIFRVTEVSVLPDRVPP